MWGYLTEFWGQIVQIGDYTVEWFQGIGNAVAGAIGGVFENLIHHLYDIFYIVQWFLTGLQDLFSILFKPLAWAFNFGKGLFETAFKTATELGLEEGQIGHFNQSVFDFLNVIPHFNIILLGVAGCLGILFLVFIVKKLSTM